MLARSKHLASVQAVLAIAQPSCHDADYVFLSVSHEEAERYWRLALVVVRDHDLCTLIVTSSQAQVWGYTVEERFSCLELNVPTALSMVGLTAHIATRLAEAGIACNVVAAFAKDLFFVPKARKEDALSLLRSKQSISKSIDD